MELQLGLALPSNPIKGFDLNNFGYEAKEVAAVSKPIHYENKKRSFDQAFDEHNNNTSRSTAAVPRTLPLFLWNNNQPNHHDNDDDPDKHQDNNSRFTIVIKNDGDGLVGWPPIKSWRKEACFHNHNHGHGHRTVGNGSGGGGRGSSNHHHSTFVKVKMEGVGIARKIDLSLHHSFRTLADTLMDMLDTLFYFGFNNCVWIDLEQVRWIQTIINSLTKTERETGFLLKMFLGELSSDRCNVSNWLRRVINACMGHQNLTVLLRRPQQASFFHMIF